MAWRREPRGVGPGERLARGGLASPSQQALSGWAGPGGSPVTTTRIARTRPGCLGPSPLPPLSQPLPPSPLIGRPGGRAGWWVSGAVCGKCVQCVRARVPAVCRPSKILNATKCLFSFRYSLGPCTSSVPPARFAEDFPRVRRSPLAPPRSPPPPYVPPRPPPPASRELSYYLPAFVLRSPY